MYSEGVRLVETVARGPNGRKEGKGAKRPNLICRKSHEKLTIHAIGTLYSTRSAGKYEGPRATCPQPQQPAKRGVSTWKTHKRRLHRTPGPINSRAAGALSRAGFCDVMRPKQGVVAAASPDRYVVLRCLLPHLRDSVGAQRLDVRWAWTEAWKTVF